MIYVEGDVPFYQFENLSKFSDLVHGLSIRAGGVSSGVFESLNLGLDVGDSQENLNENYRRFAQALKFNLKELAFAYQSHSDTVLAIHDIPKGYNAPHRDVDGFITDLTEVPLMVKFADCQGALMYDPVRRVAGAVHCGWRGNVQNILGKCVAEMGIIFGCVAKDIVVGIGPSLGPCCAEFTDPGEELPEFMQKYVNARHVDLWKCSFDQLKEAGVKPENIEIARRCTVCENEEFFSYRGGNKQTGHMGGVIMLTTGH